MYYLSLSLIVHCITTVLYFAPFPRLMAENIAILHSPITLVYNTDLRQKMTGNGGHFVTAYSHEWVSLGAIKKFSA